MNTARLIALWLAMAMALACGGGSAAWAQAAATAPDAAVAPVPEAIVPAQARLDRALAAGGEHSEEALNALFALGRAWGRAGRHDEALAMFRRARASAEARLGADHVLVSVVTIDVADQLDDLGRHGEAADLLMPAVQQLAAQLGLGHEHSARAVELLAGILGRAERHEQAVRAWRYALQANEQRHGVSALPAQRMKRRLAQALNRQQGLAEAHRLLGEVALAWRQTPPPDAGERLALELDLAHAQLGQDQPAAAHATATGVLAALQARGDAPDAEGLGRARALQAQALGMMGQWAEALEISEQLYQQSRQRHGDAADATLRAASDLAFAQRKLARYEAAAALQWQIARSREQQGPAGDTSVRQAWLDYAETIAYMGRYAEAGQILQREVTALRVSPGPRHLLTLNAMNALAGTLYELGLSAESAAVMQEVIDGRLALYGPDHSETLAAQHNKAAYMLPTGAHAEALALLQGALARIEAVPGHPSLPDVAYYYRTLGDIQQLKGQRAQAQLSLRRSLALAEVHQGPMHSFVGAVLNYLAPTVDAPEERAALYGRALVIGRANQSPEVVWRAADGLREAHARLGSPALSILYGKQAVNAIQAMRREIVSLSPRVRKAFVDSRREAYVRTADLLIAQGRLSEGQQVMAMLKDDEYHEFISRSASGDETPQSLTLNRQEAAWQQRYQQVGDRLVEIARQKAALDARLRRGQLSDDEKALHARLEADLAAGTQAFMAATRQIADEARRQAVEDGAVRMSPEAIEAVRSMRSDLKALGHGVVLLHYLVARDKLWILLTTPDTQVAREVAIPSATLNQRITVLRDALRHPRGEPLAPAQALYQLLLAPVAADLQQAQARTLMLSLDGALRYLPFAALHDGRQYAVERWRFAVITEAARSKIKDPPQAQWTMTGFGLTRAVSGFTQLPAVQDEISGLVRGGGGSEAGVMDGEALLDDAFTLVRLKAVLGDPNPVLHIASHFKFTPGTEADSFLLLGDGGRLTLQQIRQQDLRFDVDLLTLSACETAVGDNARGQEVEGLGALAQKQGAKAVLATLWPVADASTGLFMREMYRRRTEERLTKAEAIGQVQMAFLQGRLKGGGALVDRGARTTGSAPSVPATAAAPANYAHPFYWAPFILMGNWL
jgi:CHAT domain-containing protein